MSALSTTIGVWLVIAILIAVLSLARRSVPADADSGIGFADEYASEWQEEPHSVGDSPRLTVASFNIQTGKSEHGQRDIQRAAKTLVGADIAGIQEVYASSWLNRLGLGQSQTAALAAHGGFYYGFHPTRKRWFRDHRGNALLSKLPVQAWRTTMLPDWSGKSFRNFTTAELEWQGEPLVVINTHLHTGTGRDEQLKAVSAAFAKYPRVILMGDFNTTRSSTTLRALLAQDGVEDAVGALQLDPMEESRIDWIITKGFKAVGGRFLPRGVSDHPYYEVQLTLSEATTPRS